MPKFKNENYEVQLFKLVGSKLNYQNRFNIFIPYNIFTHIKPYILNFIYLNFAVFRTTKLKVKACWSFQSAYDMGSAEMDLSENCV